MAVDFDPKELGVPVEPLELDLEAANRVLNYLGNRPWIEVRQVIADFQELMKDYVLNYNLAISKKD